MNTVLHAHLAGPLALLWGASALLACTGDADVPAGSGGVAFGEEIGRVDLPGTGPMWVDGTRAFVCAGTAGVLVVRLDASGPPILEEQLDLPCQGIGGTSGSVWVAAGDLGLVVLHPGNLSTIGELVPDFPVDAVVIDGGDHAAYVAGLRSDPTGGDDDQLVVARMATWSTQDLSVEDEASLPPGDALALAYDRSAVYLLRDDGGIEVLDSRLAPLASPSVDGIADTAPDARLLLHEQVLWVAREGSGLAGLDVADPAVPAALDALSEGAAYSLAAVGDRLYVGTDDHLRILDSAQGPVPELVADVPVFDLEKPDGIHVSDGVAWLTIRDADLMVVMSVDEDQRDTGG